MVRMLKKFLRRVRAFMGAEIMQELQLLRAENTALREDLTRQLESALSVVLLSRREPEE